MQLIHTNTFREFPSFADEHLDPNKQKLLCFALEVFAAKINCLFKTKRV